ncbi:hypothetical protein Leryth_004791 [Lithospermum erythrorhizon]|nr:hypothetical protein Leryth_004791 [Lithospermum erythrorhizon]
MFKYCLSRDTSSVALSWFFWSVMHNPSVEEKILHEICDILIETRGHNLTSWLSEPLEFEIRSVWPGSQAPGGLKHVVKDDVLPDGTFVPAGSAVTYSIYSAGRMKSAWGEDCLEFKPERWLSPDGTKFYCRLVKVCLGKDLAFLQMKSIAAAVLLRHRLSLAPGHKVEQKMSLTLFMKDGLKVNVHRRDQPLLV